jgi:hypothetical protein
VSARFTRAGWCLSLLMVYSHALVLSERVVRSARQSEDRLRRGEAGTITCKQLYL